MPAVKLTVFTYWCTALLSGWGLLKRRSASPWPLWLGKDFSFSLYSYLLELRCVRFTPGAFGSDVVKDLRFEDRDKDLRLKDKDLWSEDKDK